MFPSTILAAALLGLAAPQQTPAPPAPANGIRLVVVIAVDQMIPEQLDRLAPWTTGGLARFRERGWVLSDAALEHGVTETGPGHACLGTGCHPLHHGLRANSWWSLSAQRSVYCVEDPDVAVVTPDGPARERPYAGRGRSPRNLLRPGLADFLKQAFPGSRAFSVCCKDRAAIGLSGKHPDLAVWWDRQGATGFVSSTWYAEALPDWLAAWDRGWVDDLLQGPFGGGWVASFEGALEGSGTAVDDRPGESGRSRSFPHGLPHLSEPPGPREIGALAAMVYDSPIGDAFALEVAARAVDELELGADEQPDLLAIGLSACDTVGHAYGPYSREVTDVVLRLDRGLGELFDALDERVGEDRWVAVLSADHGVLPLPENADAPGGPGERVAGDVVHKAFEAVGMDLRERFGEDFGMRVVERGLVFSPAEVTAAGIDPAELEGAAAALLLEHGGDWIEAVWTKSQLRAVAAGGAGAKVADLLRFEANSFVEDATPDVVFTPAPRHLLGLQTGTTHGTPHDYDRRVPLCFFGPGFAPGRTAGRAASVDAVPTLLDRLGIAIPPGLDGVVLRP